MFLESLFFSLSRLFIKVVAFATFAICCITMPAKANDCVNDTKNKCVLSWQFKDEKADCNLQTKCEDDSTYESGVGHIRESVLIAPTNSCKVSYFHFDGPNVPHYICVDF